MTRNKRLRRMRTASASCSNPVIPPSDSEDAMSPETQVQLHLSTNIVTLRDVQPFFPGMRIHVPTPPESAYEIACLKDAEKAIMDLRKSSRSEAHYCALVGIRAYIYKTVFNQDVCILALEVFTTTSYSKYRPPFYDRRTGARTIEAYNHVPMAYRLGDGTHRAPTRQHDLGVIDFWTEEGEVWLSNKETALVAVPRTVYIWCDPALAHEIRHHVTTTKRCPAVSVSDLIRLLSHALGNRNLSPQKRRDAKYFLGALSGSEDAQVFCEIHTNLEVVSFRRIEGSSYSHYTIENGEEMMVYKPFKESEPENWSKHEDERRFEDLEELESGSSEVVEVIEEVEGLLEVSGSDSEGTIQRVESLGGLEPERQVEELEDSDWHVVPSRKTSQRVVLAGSTSNCGSWFQDLILELHDDDET